MPVLLEGTAIVIRNDGLDRCLEGGASEFHSIAPNAMSFGDGELSQASFMSARDAEIFLQTLLLLGLRGDGESPEVVMVDAHHQSITPECDWLQLMEYNGNLIASLIGNTSNIVVAPENWDPESGPTLKHMSAEEVKDRLQFVRRDDKVDVYRDKETGDLLYSARINDTPEEMYRVSASVILENMRHPGGPPLDEKAQEEVRSAIGTLQQLVTSHEDSWRLWFLLGKAWHSVGNPDRSIQAFEHANEYAEEPQTMILKEWAGVLLELGKTRAACDIGEKAVAARPDDVELLGNLAVAYLLDQRVETAEKTIAHAISIDADDETNSYIHAKIESVRAGLSPAPRSIRELEGRSTSTKKDRDPMTEKPNRIKKKSWFQRLFRGKN